MNIAVTSLTKAARDERHRVIFAGICALILTVGLARFAYTPMLPIMRDQAGLSHLAGGWLATINYAGYMSGALLAASISDLGRKFVLYRIGLVIGVLSTAAMADFPSFPTTVQIGGSTASNTPTPPGTWLSTPAARASR